MNGKLAQNLRNPNGFFGWLVSKMMDRFNRGIIDLSIQSVHENKSDIIVEIGIGSGKTLQKIHHRFPTAMIHGVDISKDMLRSAAQKNKNLIHMGLLELHLASIEDMPIDSNSIDSVITVNTLYFWTDPNSVLIEIYRILKDGSQFILSFNPKSEMDKKHYPKDIFTSYSIEEVVELLCKHNFDIVSEQYFEDKIEKYYCVVAQK